MSSPLVPLGDLVVSAANGCGARSGDGEPTVVLRLADVSLSGELAEPASLRKVGLSERERDKYGLDRGDLLVFRVNGARDIAGRIVAYSGPKGYTYCDHFIRLKLNPARAEPRYVARAFSGGAVRQQVEQRIVSTAGQNTISQGSLLTIRVPLPSLAEQRRIADILDKADVVRRKRAEAIGLVDDLVRSVFLDMFGDPVTNPRGWHWRPMESLVREVQYGTAQKANEDRRGIPIVRMNNVTYDGKLDLSELKWVELADGELGKYTVRRGDILFNRTNSPELVGKSAVWNRDDGYAFAGYLIRVRVNELATPEYVAEFLNSSYGKKYLFSHAKPSNNMSNFSAGMFKRIPLPVPPVEMQRRFSQAVKSLRYLGERQRSGLDQANCLFTSLVHRAFRGEL